MGRLYVYVYMRACVCACMWRYPAHAISLEGVYEGALCATAVASESDPRLIWTLTVRYERVVPVASGIYALRAHARCVHVHAHERV